MVLFRELFTALRPLNLVHPTRVDAKGRFLSNFLSHHARRKQRREASEQPTDLDRVFYQLWLGSHSLHFNLTLNPYLLAPGFLTETRYGGIEGVQIRPPGSSQCHFLGEVWDERTVKGNAAISTCEGLTGLFKFSDEEFFIQPLEKSSDETSAPQAHAIYKRHVSPPSWSSHRGYEVDERRRERWEQRQRRRSRKIRRRSVSKEKWVETLVVADPKMVEYHGSKAVESYVLAVMNIVSGLFQHPSIGNAINIVVVRLILLEQDEDDLKITHHADNSLNSFCKWQKKLNMKGDEHPLHHDVAVLLTRKDICAAVNMPCETLGLSHVAGMCQPHRSCSINEDTGLPLAFTVAHELGHNFGIQHDGSGNDCEPIGKQPFVMSPQLLYATSQPRWSRCSRQHITRFLDRGWGWCLDDAPVKEKLSLNPVLPGVLYSAAHQCRLQYGSGSLLCDDMENVCSTLWCTVGTTCHSKLDGAVDGTSCGEGRWCFSGECVAVGYQPKSINGGWASWSEWSACSRTCGAGVQSAQRECDNPVPKYRGKYCLGERQRYRICNTTPCPRDLPMFRDVQCSHFNTMPYKGKLYKWEVVINTVNPCELHCRPLNEHFSEKLRDAVIDGTPCFEGNKSRDMCINGICKSVGCDYVIDSSAVEDQCGVCRGNGSTCMTVRRTFEKREGLGYVDIGLIPEGAWHIRIEEVAEAGNFLALQSDNLKYFLNGGWTIQWNGDYKAAGTVFTYVRTGHLETLMSPGPTMEPLWIQLLFQETNPGVWFEYTISRNVSDNNTIDESVFFWKYGSWTECSVTCGTGFQKQIIHCVEKTTGIVEESFCDPLTRPDDSQTSCNKDPCPAIWSVGEWGKCSASCGSSGLTQRTVLCIRAASVEEQKVLQPSECEHIPKPETLSSCSTHIPCPADWTTGSWSKCSLTCGSGARHRNVTCSRNTGVDCDPQKKPPAVTTCHIQDCPKVVDNFGDGDWSGSGWPIREVLNEISSIPEAKLPPKYSSAGVQLKNHNNLNNIVKADFHYHNNIENTDHNNVQIDDFYYDYNFINFHEDLSDGLESDGRDSEDRFGAPPEDEATRSVKENASMETTRAPTHTSAIFTFSKPTGYTLKPEETHNINLNSASPVDFLPTAMEQMPTRPGRTGIDVTSFNGADFDYNEIVIPPMERSSSKSDPFTTDSAAIPQHSTGPVKHMESPTPTVPISSTYPPFLWPFPVPTSAPTSASTQVTAAYWVTGNWSTVSFFMQMKYLVVVPTHIYLNYLETPIDLELMQLIACAVAVYASTSQYTQCKESSSLSFYFCGQCSTSCGLGAVWRTSVCSTGSDSDCDPVKRPAPAQQCYLRPCSTWKVGEWSKCSKNCDSGIKSREAQCFDMRDQRPLRPFHCRAMSSRPQTQIPCNLQPCLTWYTSSWGQCSEVCGGGEQQRIVTCPEEDQCDRDLQPSSIQACNTQPCVQWLTGSWGECSASCGGGVQRRLIKCVNTKAEVDEEVDQAQCHHEPQPESTQNGTLSCCIPKLFTCSRSKFIFDFDVCVSLKMMTRKGSNFALLVYFGCRRCLKFTILFFLEGRVFCSAL
uniref:A disintegrin and metalloproteinase with thrombospondin motifs 7-like n=1 Tax=Mastacembelus armatus TaxID=205130 RepID=A0A7N8X4B9_9TELE